jgi:anti-anti-sigma factor
MNSNLTLSNSLLLTSRQILAATWEMPSHKLEKREDAAARLTIAERVYKNVRIVELTGAIDLDTSVSLHRFLQRRLREKPTALLLDFAGVSSIDATGLAVLIDYLREARRFNGHFALSGLGPRVLAAMSIMRLEPMFIVFENTMEALAEMAQVSSAGSPRRQVPRLGRKIYNPFSLACAH